MTDDDANNSALAYADTLWRSVDTLCGPVDAAERYFPGFCKSETIVEKYPRLLAELEKHFDESERFTGVIREALGRVHGAD